NVKVIDLPLKIQLLWNILRDTSRVYNRATPNLEVAWKANAIGRSSKTVREFLEKSHKDDLS
ncbi:hypothetical protein MPER_16244, partial [Moniliophthora perniciosa FA553]